VDKIRHNKTKLLIRCADEVNCCCLSFTADTWIELSTNTGMKGHSDKKKERKKGNGLQKEK
jgi:hypothetical protein